MALASCPARQGQQRSFAPDLPALELGMCTVGFLLHDELVPPPVRSKDVVAGAVVALVGQHDQSGEDQCPADNRLQEPRVVLAAASPQSRMNCPARRSASVASGRKDQKDWKSWALTGYSSTVVGTP